MEMMDFRVSWWHTLECYTRFKVALLRELESHIKKAGLAKLLLQVYDLFHNKDKLVFESSWSQMAKWDIVVELFSTEHRDKMIQAGMSQQYSRKKRVLTSITGFYKERHFQQE